MNSAATYLGPASGPKDAVRFYIGDTDMNRPLMSDAEVLFCLSMCNGVVLSASVMACQSLIARLGSRTSETVGPVSAQYGGVVEGLKAQLSILRRQMALTAVPFSGGLYVDDKLANATDPSIVQPAFTRTTLIPPQYDEGNPNAPIIQQGGGADDGDGEIVDAESIDT